MTRRPFVMRKIKVTSRLRGQSYVYTFIFVYIARLCLIAYTEVDTLVEALVTGL